MKNHVTSSIDKVIGMYDDSASGYDRMMDEEIKHPVYAEILGRLKTNISSLPGSVLDSSCGSGHMLKEYNRQWDGDRPLIGVDISHEMVKISRGNLGANAMVHVGDMRILPMIEDGSCAAVINFFALHHVNGDELLPAFREWNRLLAAGGQLLIGAWEGNGPIDYGEESDLAALKYKFGEIEKFLQEAGFRVDRHQSIAYDEFGMDAVYIESTKIEE